MMFCGCCFCLWVQVWSVPTAPSAITGGFGGAASQQATRHARRIYVGGLPPSASEQNISTFFRWVGRGW